jgi:cytochrome c oxidase subunit 1
MPISSAVLATGTARDAGSGVNPGVVAYLTVSGIVLLLMMLLGLVLRLAQAEWLTLPPDLFYALMTAHGAGMVGIAGLAGAGIMWHFLSRYVDLSQGILIANLVLFLAGVVMILAAIFLGGFGGAWTFLYPLPATSGGVWEPPAAALYLGGLLVIGVGFLLFFLDAGRAIIAAYGGLGAALGWPVLFGSRQARLPEPAVVASTMVVIVNTLGLVSGAAVLAVSLINLAAPSFAVDPLLAKNMTYFFGHVFINATIYMAVIAVYEILPHYTGREWRASKPFLWGWTTSTLMVLIAYPHHLLMDFVMPEWALIIGQVASYAAGLPVLVVTAYGALTLVYRSGVRWDAASSLLFLSMFGWAAGILPAIIDATITVNLVMHNTMWVPGHFHFYLLLGMGAMVFGFMYDLGRERGSGEGTLDRLAVWLFAAGGLGLALVFLYSGKAGVPRRWAVHLPEWLAYDRLASLFALAVIAAVLVFAFRFLVRVPRLIAMR